MRLRHLQRFFDDLDALALEDIGKARVVLEQRVIEFGDQGIVLPIPILKLRRNQATRLIFGVEADVEEFQRGRMVGAGARHLIEEIVVRKRLIRTTAISCCASARARHSPTGPAPTTTTGSDFAILNAAGNRSSLRRSGFLRRHDVLHRARPAFVGQIEHKAGRRLVFRLVE